MKQLYPCEINDSASCGHLWRPSDHLRQLLFFIQIPDEILTSSCWSLRQSRSRTNADSVLCVQCLRLLALCTALNGSDQPSATQSNKQNHSATQQTHLTLSGFCWSVRASPRDLAGFGLCCCAARFGLPAASHQQSMQQQRLQLLQQQKCPSANEVARCVLLPR